MSSCGHAHGSVTHGARKAETAPVAGEIKAHENVCAAGHSATDTNATAWMNFDNMVRSDVSQTRKAVNYTPLI